MILFNNTGPCAFFVYTGGTWFPFGYCEKSPQIKYLDRYQPIHSASTGEMASSADDEAFQGKELYVDATFNFFDERLISFITASPKHGFVTQALQNNLANPAFPGAFANRGGLDVTNSPLPVQPFTGTSTGNRQPGIFDRRDFGALVSENNCGFPIAIMNMKFKPTYPQYANREDSNQNFGNVCPPPGVTLLSAKSFTEIDLFLGHGPHQKRFIFQAVPVRVPFTDENMFGRFKRKKRSNFPGALLDLSNYHLDNGYTNSVPNLGTIPGGRVLYILGIPKGLVPVDPATLTRTQIPGAK